MFISERVQTDWTPRLLSIARIFVALLYLQHGLSKYFGFPTPPPANFHMFSLYGLAGAIETIGSLLLLLGLFTRPVAFIMSGEMAVAYFMNRPPRGFFPLVNGGSLEYLYCFVFFIFFLVGPGSWSLDAVIAKTKGVRSGRLGTA
jgi:putative oxidoreductase